MDARDQVSDITAWVAEILENSPYPFFLCIGTGQGAEIVFDVSDSENQPNKNANRSIMIKELRYWADFLEENMKNE